MRNEDNTMKNVLIIGAMGYGREIFDFIQFLNSVEPQYNVKGFLDDRSNALDGFNGFPKILTSVENYEPLQEDYFICAVGEAKARWKYINMIKERNGTFVSLIHPASAISDKAHIGEGVIIPRFCSISNNVSIGDFSIMHPFCNIGHNASVGRNTSIGSHCFIGGGASVGDTTMVHPHATILPHVVVGDNVVVGAGSVVIRNVKDNMTVFGVPAKRIEY